MSSTPIVHGDQSEVNEPTDDLDHDFFAPPATNTHAHEDLQFEAAPLPAGTRRAMRATVAMIVVSLVSFPAFIAYHQYVMPAPATLDGGAPSLPTDAAFQGAAAPSRADRVMAASQPQGLVNRQADRGYVASALGEGSATGETAVLTAEDSALSGEEPTSPQPTGPISSEGSDLSPHGEVEEAGSDTVGTAPAVEEAIATAEGVETGAGNETTEATAQTGAEVPTRPAGEASTGSQVPQAETEIETETEAEAKAAETTEQPGAADRGTSQTAPAATDGENRATPAVSIIAAPPAEPEKTAHTAVGGAAQDPAPAPNPVPNEAPAQVAQVAQPNVQPLPAATEGRPNLSRAYELLNSGRFADAVEVAAAVTHDQPGQAEAWMVLGAAQDALGHRAEAQSAYQRCSENAGPHAANCRLLLR